MSDPQKNQFLVLIGGFVAIGTLLTQIIGVGVFKGTFEEKVRHLENQVNISQARNDEQDRDIRKLDKATDTILSRLNGISSQVGKVPGKVAAKINEENDPQ